MEGFGAVLVIPAIAALTAASYEGKERALAYALLGGVAAIAVAAGPLIGGFVTTESSWRYVFAAETVVVIGILLLRGQDPAGAARRAAPAARPASASRCRRAGLGLIVFAILRSSVWGFVQFRARRRRSAAPRSRRSASRRRRSWCSPASRCSGRSSWWEERRAAPGHDQLLDTTLLRVPQLRAGLSTLLGQQLVLMGTFFVIPVYLQVVLGLDAFETGKRLLPLSLAMLVFAHAGPADGRPALAADGRADRAWSRSASAPS